MVARKQLATEKKCGVRIAFSFERPSLGFVGGNRRVPLFFFSKGRKDQMGKRPGLREEEERERRLPEAAEELAKPKKQREVKRSNPRQAVGLTGTREAAAAANAFLRPKSRKAAGEGLRKDGFG